MAECQNQRIGEVEKEIARSSLKLELQNGRTHRHIGLDIGLVFLVGSPRRAAWVPMAPPLSLRPPSTLRYFISLLVSLCLSFSFFIWRMKYESENWNEIMKRESMRLSSLFLSLYLILYFSLRLFVAFSLLLSFIHNFINICPIFGFFPVWVLVLMRLLIVF